MCPLGCWSILCCIRYVILDANKLFFRKYLTRVLSKNIYSSLALERKYAREKNIKPNWTLFVPWFLYQKVVGFVEKVTPEPCRCSSDLSCLLNALIFQTHCPSVLKVGDNKSQYSLYSHIGLQKKQDARAAPRTTVPPGLLPMAGPTWLARVCPWILSLLFT